MNPKKGQKKVNGKVNDSPTQVNGERKGKLQGEKERVEHSKGVDFGAGVDMPVKFPVYARKKPGWQSREHEKKFFLQKNGDLI